MFLITDILDKKDINILLDYYEEQNEKVRWEEAYYNLHNLHMIYGERKYEKYNNILEKLEDVSGHKATRHYMLNYIKGSFCRMHYDATEYNTYVTLLEEKDLEGGEVLTGDEKRCIDVRHVDVGQTMIYDKGLQHGVAQVRKGNRKVFIVWF